MSTTFAAAPAPAAQPYQQHAYRKSTQYSPTQTAASTPANVSPTSPRSTQLVLPRHQGIYQPRTAIGVPAALRKTEKPACKSPPRADSGLASPTTTWPVADHSSPSQASQIAHGDMLSLCQPVPLSPGAGPITRNHWQVCRNFSSISILLLSSFPSLPRSRG